MDLNKEHNKNEFGTPGDYFDKLEDRLGDLTTLEDLMPPSEGFGVPEGYFKEFEEKLASRLGEPKTRTLPLWRKSKPMLYAAAAIALLLLGTWFSNDNEYSMEDLRTADVEWLLNTGALEIPESYLVEFSGSSDLADLSLTENEFEAKALEEFILDDLDIYELSE